MSMVDPAKNVIVDIVTWNSARYLAPLFRSFESQTSKDFSITIIDNASTDETLPWLQEHYPEVTVLRNFRNLGFAKAHNQGIALALRRWREAGVLDRRYVFVLNPDTFLEPHCIERLTDFMNAHPEIVIAGPKAYRATRAEGMDEDSEMDYVLSKELDTTGLLLLKTHKFAERGAGEEDRGQYDIQDVFGVSGSAMMIRASAIEHLCLSDGQVFDEDLFAYKEDADLCWRARLMGFAISFVSDAMLWHVRHVRDSGASGLSGLLKNHFSRSSNLVYLSRRNQTWLEWKNDDFINRLIHMPWLTWQWILNVGGAILFGAHRRGFFDALKGYGKMHAKRAEIQSCRKLRPEEMRKWFS